MIRLTIFSLLSFLCILATLPSTAFGNTSGENSINTSQPDYDGDGKADLVIRRIEKRLFSIIHAHGETMFNATFGGLEYDIPVYGDFDGDGLTDLAVRRLGSMSWKVKNSSNSNYNSQFDETHQLVLLGREKEDIPAVGDYDGDGISDFAVFRPSTQMWYVRLSSLYDSETVLSDITKSVSIGASDSAVPVPGDFDGDGITDMAVFNASSSQWTIYKSSQDAQMQDLTLGSDENDIAIAADYDGDGIDDTSVWNSKTRQWTIKESRSGKVVKTVFGTTETDVPIVADYDGDSRADIALRSLADRSVHIIMSSTNTLISYRLGHYGDIPVNAPSYLVMKLVKEQNIQRDSDDDGITDEDEVEVYGSDPYLADTDGDGISDSEEVYRYFTDPTKADSDNDGLSDSEEIAKGTNPRLADSDGDGVIDSVDVFPTNSAESVDSDADGVGDNADAYPTQPACHREDEGNGNECYATWITRQSVAKVTNNSADLVFFQIGSRNKDIIAYNLKSQSYRQLPYQTEERDSLTSMEFSEQHNRLYLGFSSGKVAYVDAKDFVSQEFAKLKDPVQNIIAIGPHVLINERYNSWSQFQRHHIFDVNGQQTDRSEWNKRANSFAWNQRLNRVYALETATTANDLLYQTIDPSVGSTMAFGERTLNYQNSLQGQILVSPQGDKLLLPQGNIYNAESLEPEDTSVTDYDKGLWSENSGLLLASQQGSQFRVRNYNSTILMLETLTYEGTLLDIVPQTEKSVLVIKAGSDIKYVDFVPKADSDNDGTVDILDAFPNDPAAAVDTDNDGAPDRWNTGYGRSDVTPGMELDVFPTESSCFLHSHTFRGTCDPTTRLQFSTLEATKHYNGIQYSLSGANNRINRWNAATETYLHPILLVKSEIYGKASSFAVDEQFGVLVGYDTGHIVRYGIDGLQPPLEFANFTSHIDKIFVINQFVVAVHNDRNWWSTRQYTSLNSAGERLHTYDRGDASNDFDVVHSANRLYWFSNSSWDSIESMVLTGDGDWTHWRSRRYNSRPTGFMTVADDESKIVTGNSILVTNHLSVQEYSHFDIPANIPNDASLIDFVWLDNIAVGLYSSGDNRYLGFHSTEVDRQYSGFEIEPGTQSIHYSDNGVIGISHTGTGYRIKKYELDVDNDQDGLPLWWESIYGLDDNNSSDAATDADQDNLNNLLEFQNRTNPTLTDSDGDGLSDGREVLELLLNPIAADTDGDMLPDNWEVENGLNAADDSDALQDADGDGINNYHEYLTGFDPQDSASVPQVASNLKFSFEDNELPAELSLSKGNATFESNQAYDGTIALSTTADTEIQWQSLFGNVELEFYVYSDCSSDWDKYLRFSVDGEQRLTTADGQLRLNSPVPRDTWLRYNFLIKEGFRSISIDIDDRWRGCSLYIDNLAVSPMPTLFEMGVNKVFREDASLFLYNYFDVIQRHVSIPSVFNYENWENADITVLQDGRIAVFNGRYSPALSIYTPEDDSWQHTQAENWASGYNQPGGIVEAGNKIFVTDATQWQDQTSGLIVFDMNNGTTTQIQQEGLINIALGQDGHIYALTEQGYRNYSVIQYDPGTYQTIGTVPVDLLGNAKAFAIDSDGNLYISHNYNEIAAFDSDGNTLQNVAVEAAWGINDIAVDPQKRLFIGDFRDRILQSDTGFTDFTLLQIRGDYLAPSPFVDSDNDGVPDWWEASFGLNMTDAIDGAIDVDGDGLTALMEYNQRTEERNSDSDGDGLSDGREVLELSLNPNSADTDEDLMPDAWEVANGLKGNDASDASIDSDNDGVSNLNEYLTGFDPQDSSSTPEVISNSQFSFEDSTVPQQFTVARGTPEFSTSQSYQGNVSMFSRYDLTLEWQALFSDLEVEFYLYSNCTASWQKRYRFSVDGESSNYIDLEPGTWTRLVHPITAGYKAITFELDSQSSSCELFIDNIATRPLPTLYEMGTNLAVQQNGQLYLYDYFGATLRNIAIPTVNDSISRIQDITALDDGRIAVFNGANEPVLSVYTPQTHSWKHLSAPGLSRFTSRAFGGIDAIGNRVILTNMSTSSRPDSGLAVFDLTDDSVSYIDGPTFIDLTVGQNGSLYALTDNTGWRQYEIHQYRPDTLQVISITPITINSLNSIAVDATGQIYGTDANDIVLINSSGDIAQRFEIDGASALYDITLDSQGNILVSDSNERVFKTSTALQRSQQETMRADFVDLVPNIDTDGDGIPDWWEVTFGLNMNDAGDATTDSDNDGLTALLEFQNGTEESNADTDGDGLSDGKEVLELFIDPLSQDTDGDLLPDAWEVANGLDANNSNDAMADADNDGISNYHEYLTGYDPQDSNSAPSRISNAVFSFEDSVLPEELNLTSGTVEFSTEQAFDGSVSLAFPNDTNIEWQALFGDVELEISFYNDCAFRWHNSYRLTTDNQFLAAGNIEPDQWVTERLLLKGGYQTLRINIDNRTWQNCHLYIDQIVVRPMPTVFEMGVNRVTQERGILRFYNAFDELVRSVNIPRVNDSASSARDIAVLDDGRVAVFNGVNHPALSIYTAQSNSWQHLEAAQWSNHWSGSYGGIDAIGNKVYVTNMNTSGKSTSGIVQFDLGNNSIDYFEVTDFVDLTVGQDGFIYGFTGGNVYQFDPQSLAWLKTVSTARARSIAVDSDGNIYAATSNSQILKYGNVGALINTLAAQPYSSFYDIALSDDGVLLLADNNDRISQTVQNIETLTATTLRGNFVDFVPNIDTDLDGLPDWWEGAFALDMKDPFDALLDHDSDGLSATEEYQAGTHARNADSDGDGLTDGFEVNTFGTSPVDADSDNDGLSDGEENRLGTSGTHSDSDGDGLSDYDEVNIHETNPNSHDSDGDGMNDAYEISFGLNAAQNDADHDNDGDALSNLQEHDLGTNPNLADTDGDTLSDYDEVFTHQTSPVLADTDSDRMPDNWELRFSLNPNSANDASLDNDADQFSNLEEYQYDTNPNDANDYPLPITWANYQGNERHTGYTPHILDSNNFNLKWQITLPWSRSNPVTATDEMVFVSSDLHWSEQGIAGVSAATGNIIWQLDYGRSRFIGAPSYYDNKVYFQIFGNSDAYLRALDSNTGALHFENAYDRQWSKYPAPTVYDGDIFMTGGGNDNLYHFDADTGIRHWRNNTGSYNAVVNKQHVFVVASGGLHVIDKNTGETQEFIQNENGNRSNVISVMTLRGNIISAHWSGLTVFDSKSRTVKWESNNIRQIAELAVANGIIYTIAGSRIYAVDENTGEILWSLNTRNYVSNIVVTKTHLFVADRWSTYAVNLKNLTEDWSYPATGHLSLSEDGTLYISGQTLTAISLK